MRAFLLSLLMLATTSATAGDRSELQTLLNDFLTGAAHDPAVHRRFWADDLIYTSSAGERFGKQVILQGMDRGTDSAQNQSGSASYSAEDVDIRLFGETAVIAFKLVGKTKTESGEETLNHYFNTGTFIKRNGEWRAIAWQATKIPQKTGAD